MQHLDPVLLKSVILLLPMVATGIAFIIKQPDYFQRVGLLLALLFNIPYLFLLNALAAKAGWWIYQESSNNWRGIPIEVILGWSVFWGVFLPWMFRSVNITFTVLAGLAIDLWFMPHMSSLFTLSDSWLIGELFCCLLVLLPSLLIFKLTWKRKHVLTRAFIQSLIWGGWIVFLIPEIVLQRDHSSMFDIFDMQPIRVILFLTGMAISMLIGYLALYEFAIRGLGTPIPFDPPQRLVTSGIYSVVANPLQISTTLMFICIMFAYQEYIMLLPIISMIIYTKIFVKWHHSIDIEKRFGTSWIEYRSNVRNWLPVISRSARSQCNV